MLRKNEKTIAYVQQGLDAFIVLVCWGAAYYIRFHTMDGQTGLLEKFFQISLALTIITLYIFSKNGLYNSQRFKSRYEEIFTLLKANATSFICLVLALYFFKFKKISRIHLGMYFTFSTVSLLALRLMVRNFLRTLRRKGYNLRHILLVGNSNQLTEYVHMARTFKDSGLNFIGWYDDDGLAKKNNIKAVNSISDIKPDAIVLSYSPEQSNKISTFLKNNYNELTPIQILPDLSYSLVGHQIEEFAGIPLITFNQPDFSSIELFLKRSFDFLATLIGCLIISPLLLIISIMVKLSSPGPIFYGQERIGINGKKFTMWKFRSMKMATDGEDKTTWSSKDDPRKTKFGSFIRKTSLDELPQLWNVLVGDMSLVGPRPERPHFVNQFKGEIPNYMLRHKMKAGITGWAQINGWRGDTSLVKRIECDIYYIKNWSFWFDIKIIILTFIKGFINKNAY